MFDFNFFIHSQIWRSPQYFVVGLAELLMLCMRSRDETKMDLWDRKPRQQTTSIQSSLSLTWKFIWCDNKFKVGMRRSWLIISTPFNHFLKLFKPDPNLAQKTLFTPLKKAFTFSKKSKIPQIMMIFYFFIRTNRDQGSLDLITSWKVPKLGRIPAETLSTFLNNCVMHGAPL